MCISPAWLLAAAALSWLTILISALIPAKRAKKTSAIELLRQNQDTKVTQKDVKVSAITTKIFGFPALAAKKYYKRSRKKYRVTIFSPAVSIILAVVSGALIDYVDFLFSGYANKGYDIAYQISFP